MLGKFIKLLTSHNLASVVLIAIFIRIIFLNSSAHADLISWAEMARRNFHFGYWNAYQDLSLGLYPPLYHIILGIIGAISSHFGNIYIWLKTLPIFFDLLIIWLLYQRSPLSSLLYAINPAVVYNNSIAAMIGDPIFSYLLVLSIYLYPKHTSASIAIYTLGILTKPQPLFFLPLFGLLWLQQPKPALKGVITGGIIALTILSPFVYHSTFKQAIFALLKTSGWFPYLHVRAPNLWFLLSGGRDPWGMASNLDEIFPFNLSLFNNLSDTNIKVPVLLLFLVFQLFLFTKFKKKSRFTPFFLLALTAFLFLPEMHRNYIFPAIVIGHFAITEYTQMSWHLLIITSGFWLSWFALPHLNDYFIRLLYLTISMAYIFSWSFIFRWYSRRLK